MSNSFKNNRSDRDQINANNVNYNNHNDGSTSKNKYIIIGLLVLVTGVIFIFLLMPSGQTINSYGDGENFNISGGTNNISLPKKKALASTSNLSIGVWVDNNNSKVDWLNDKAIKFPAYGNDLDVFFGAGILTYKGENTSGVFTIKPNLRQYEKIKNGEVITGGRSQMSWTESNDPPYFVPQFPELDIKIANNSDESVFVDHIELVVDRSKIDYEPLIFLYDEGGINGELAIQFYNDGYGKVLNPRIEYNLVQVGSGKVSFSNFRHSARLDQNLKHSVENDLPSYGISWKDEYKWFDPPKVYDYMGQLRPIGTNKYIYDSNVSAMVAGILTYEWNNNGKMTKESLPFLTPIRFPTTGYGAALGSSASYTTNLRTEGNNYKLNLGVSHSLSPGEVDRLKIDLSVAKSSYHSFKVRVYYNGGEEYIESKPIEAHILFTKSCAKFNQAM